MKTPFAHKFFSMIFSRIKIKRRGALVDFITHAADAPIIPPVMVTSINYIAGLSYIFPPIPAIAARYKAIYPSFCCGVFATTFNTSSHNN